MASSRPCITLTSHHQLGSSSAIFSLGLVPIEGSGPCRLLFGHRSYPLVPDLPESSLPRALASPFWSLGGHFLPSPSVWGETLPFFHCPFLLHRQVCSGQLSCLISCAFRACPSRPFSDSSEVLVSWVPLVLPPPPWAAFSSRLFLVHVGPFRITSSSYTGEEATCQISNSLCSLIFGTGD